MSSSKAQQDSAQLLDGSIKCWVQAVYEQAVEQKDRVAQGRALWQLGSVLGDQGQFKNAEVPLRDALAILEAELGSDHLDIAKACNGMPNCLCLRKKKEEASADRHYTL